ncbi:MAG: aspartate kinase [Oscillospiraceae bacterium]|jgi:aspartate kinase|nr:aspartate kinase [Oscillospiraceae bacterium]
MPTIVTKFGGTSLCDAAHFQNVASILNADPARRFVVPSAPGKRFDSDEKVTDLLYQCHRLGSTGQNFDKPFNQIIDRFREIAEALGLSDNWQRELAQIRQRIPGEKTADYAASRGEYLCGKMLAEYLGWDFLDPTEVVCFDADGNLDSECTHTICKAELSHFDKAVIPGFYGAMPDGRIRTFSRGGSDITGAIVARAAMASLYENWTDVPGFLMADPRVVENPRLIDCLTYRELRELSYMGASVLHEDAVFPVRKAGIPVNIRSTVHPDHPGTRIVPQTDQIDATITGIAGRKGFKVITVEKALMNAETGFGRRVLQAVEEQGISFEHMPSGIDTLCVVLDEKQLEGKQKALVSRIYELTDPDTVDVKGDLALIATVGRGMVRQRGISAKLFGALLHAGVNVRMIDQGSSELNIIVGVDESDFETAVRAIYKAFIE